MPRSKRDFAKTSADSYVVLNGKKLRLVDDASGKATGDRPRQKTTKYFAGDTLRVKVSEDSRIVSDSEAEAQYDSDSSADDDNNADEAYAIVAVDHDPEIHGSNLKIRWFYSKEELPISSRGFPKDNYVFSYCIETIDITCITKHSRGIDYLPEKINNALYNADCRKLEIASPEFPGFNHVRELLQLRMAARTDLAKNVKGKLQAVRENQVCVAVDCLLNSTHLFAKHGPISHYVKTVDESQKLAAWTICFGPLLIGNALTQLLHVCSFKAHKDAITPASSNSDSDF